MTRRPKAYRGRCRRGKSCAADFWFRSGDYGKVTEQLNDSDACIIDINMGCPTPKITKNGDGCALMRQPELVGKIVREVSKASVKPVTVKIRKGWDENRINAVEIARIARRTAQRQLRFTEGQGTVLQWQGGLEHHKEVKQSVSIPVIGNGDVFTPEDARRMFEETNCDAIMIGRGAQGNPWIFRKIIKYLEGSEDFDLDISLETKINIIKRHMQMLVELKGEQCGVREMRKHIAWYIKGMRNASRIKEKVFKATTQQEVFSLLDELWNSTCNNVTKHDI